MAYKARRTRDLQGEVQAGTNVSVSETTKPDGTKVYTLSADSGEIQTLADMINSCCQYEVACSYDNNTNIFHIDYTARTDIEDYPEESFYKEATIDDFYGYKGLQILKKGLYRISVRIEITILATSDIYEIPLHLRIFGNGFPSDLYNVMNVTSANNGEYKATFSTDILMDFDENDIFTYYVEHDNPDITDIYISSSDYILNIQKLR